MTKPNKIASTVASLRASEWWESKFGPLFGTIYATSFILQIPFISLLPFVAFLLIALLSGASFVSVINDLTDLEEDKLAGKNNRLAGKSKQFALTLIFVCLVIGVIVSFFLSKISFILYLAAWIVFTLYSLPPIRLKKRGIWGVFADTLGANVFPQLFAIAVLTEWFGKDFDFWWFFAIGIWSFLLGLRGIISHQLIDRQNDKAAGIKTFVQNYETSSIRRLANWLIFPLELTAFVWLIYYSGNLWGFVFLGVYVLLSVLIHLVWKIKFSVVTQSNKERLLLSEYYFLFYPISFLLAGLTVFPYSWIVIILHLGLFSQSVYKLISELFRLFTDIRPIVREFLLGY